MSEIKNKKMHSIVYGRDEVVKASIEYFNGDVMAAEVWANKYCLKDSDGNYYENTPDDMHHRIANELFRIEKKYPNPVNKDDIYESLKGFKRLVPQGSPMSGIGNNIQNATSLSNCFVIGNGNSDSYGGIFKIDQNIAQLQKRRAGVGTDLDFIRPSGSLVNNSALTSTGVVPFMRRYSNTTKEVAQDGRRGALMLSISAKHPDSEAFIDAKLTKGEITGANISVKLDDEFMNSALNGNEYIQQFPVDSKTPTTTKNTDANKLWKKIIHNAWKSAEPGVLYWDTVIRESIPDCYSDLGYKTISTNPCFSGNEKLLTPQGYKTFEELCDIGTIQIINSKGNIVESKVWSTGVKETIKLKNSIGESFICTPDHRWLTIDNVEIEAKDLKGKRLMPFIKKNDQYDELFTKLGFIQGDGGLGRLKSETHKGFEINIGDKDNDVLDFFGYKKETINQRKWYTNEFYEICKDLEFSSEELPNRVLPNTFRNWNLFEKLSFIRGLYSANGSIIKNHRISFKTTSIGLIKELQDFFNEIGISTYYTTNKEKLNKFSNGEYLMKESYDLNIGKFVDIKYFYENIGFIHEYKNSDLFDLIKIKSPLIRTIKNHEKIEVYDFIEPENHWGVVNGYIAHNCGEITLCESDSCRLLAINLYGYVRNPFTEDAYFDFDAFKKDVRLGQRFMDDIVDLELEKIDIILAKIENDPENKEIKTTEKKLWLDIKDKALRGRRTGLGITAEGDMLAALGYRYGSDESIDFSEKVHKTLKLEAYRSSVELAKERGAFPIYDSQREMDNPFLNRIKEQDPALYDEMIEYGRRNIALLTIAPTGTLSMMTQTTSGIEPVFLPVYKRRRKINPQEKNVRVDFTDDEGQDWTEYNVFHHHFKTWLEVKGYDVSDVEGYTKERVDELVKLSPYYKSTSNDLDWVKKVELQGKVQQHVDHSISCTVNIPKDTTEDIVEKIYKMGWESGCKGLTIYRDGSRDGVLISDDDKKEEKLKTMFNDNHAPKRPKRIEGSIIRFKNNHEDWIAVIGNLDERPYEIFTGKLENGLSKLPKYVDTCVIVKNIVDSEDGNKRKRYDLEYLNEDGELQISEGVSHKFNPEYWNYAKFVSGLLRHGMPIESVYELIETLSFKEDHLFTWKKGVSRALKKFIANGKKAKGSCPVCGGINTLEYKEGCLTCSCGNYGKCG